MTDQQFCLRWNNHQSTLVAVFDGLLEKGVLVDCTLAAEGQQLTAHKVVLAACSPFLETLLSRHYDKHPILILKDVKFSELKAMMDYMYRGEVNISQDQLGTFLKAAESLQIKGLSDGGGGDKDPYPTKRHHERKPLRPTSPVRNSVNEVKRTPPPSYLHTSMRNSLKPTPLLVDIPEDSPINRGRDGSLSPVPRKKKRPREVDDPLNNNVVAKPEVAVDEPVSNHQDSGEEPARVPSPDAKPDPILDKTDPAAHLKHELIEEEEDINEDSVEFGMDDDDQGEAGTSHNEGDFKGDFYSGTQDGDNRDGQARSMPHYLPYLTPKEIAALEYERLLMTGKPEDLPKIHACHTCGRCYKIRSTLNRHQRYECGIARKKLACEICGKKFSRPDNLKQHEQTHVTIFFSGEGGDFASQANGPNNGPNFSVAVKTELGGPISAEGRSPLMADANVSTDDGDKITVTPQIYLIEDSKNYPIPTQPVLQKLQVPSPAGLQKMGIQKIQLQNPSQN